MQNRPTAAPRQASTAAKQPSARHNRLLIAGVIALAATPLLLVRGEYSGVDGQARKAVETIQPSYKPWFEPLIELPSGDIESLLFASQAALGAGVVGFVTGLYRGRSLARKRDTPPAP
jgi:cobalt/nickel transport protein